jgi:short-subunit dehydrogenase
MTTQQRRAQSFEQRYGPWALITGAARGLGAAFAERLARRGLDCMLVDIDGPRLRERASFLATSTGRQIEAIELDLTRPDLLAELTPLCGEREIGLLINNAGRGQIERFLARPLERHLEDLHLNARAPLMLSHHLGTQMALRGRGGMVFVSSASALHGTPYVAQYAATKAYDLVLAEGLHLELAPLGVDVLALLPGQVRTPGWEAESPKLTPGVSVMESEAVVDEALAQLGRRSSWIAGRSNRAAFALLSRLLPRAAAARIIGSTIRRVFSDKIDGVS